MSKRSVPPEDAYTISSDSCSESEGAGSNGKRPNKKSRSSVKVIVPEDNQDAQTVLSRSDPAWKHCILIDIQKGKVQCRYCNKIMFDGISRLKHHISGKKGNVTQCNKVPLKDKNRFRIYLKLLNHGKLSNLCHKETVREEISQSSHRRVHIYGIGHGQRARSTKEYEIFDEDNRYAQTVSSRSDPAWKHCFLIDMQQRKVQCRYCNKIVFGGISRLKHHIAGKKGNVTQCNKAPLKVKNQFRIYLKLLEHGKLSNSLHEETVREKISQPSHHKVHIYGIGHGRHARSTKECERFDEGGATGSSNLDTLTRKAEMYQEYMRTIPITHEQGSVIPFKSWQGLARSMKQVHGQPLHYLTNVVLKQWDRQRMGSKGEHTPLDEIIHPAKAEALIWVTEELHRLTCSHHYLARLWSSDPMYHVFVDSVLADMKSSDREA